MIPSQRPMRIPSTRRPWYFVAVSIRKRRPRPRPIEYRDSMYLEDRACGYLVGGVVTVRRTGRVKLRPRGSVPLSDFFAGARQRAGSCNVALDQV